VRVSRPKAPSPDTAITYVRVSTEDQARSGLGLGAQRARVADECTRRGWLVVDEYADEGVSARTITKRAGLVAALEQLERGAAAHLVVYKLDRLSRSVHDFTGIVERSRRQGWSVTVMDLGFDTSTPVGAMAANVLASFAQFEREMGAQRTSDALQVLKARGVELGRPDRAAGDVVDRVARARQAGESLRSIARRLNAAAIPPPQGGTHWRHTSVAAVLRRSPSGGAETSTTEWLEEAV
jgi:DNA invertase Pin-like site-specific DNA recombinase